VPYSELRPQIQPEQIMPSSEHSPTSTLKSWIQHGRQSRLKHLWPTHRQWLLLIQLLRALAPYSPYIILRGPPYALPAPETLELSLAVMIQQLASIQLTQCQKIRTGFNNLERKRIYSEHPGETDIIEDGRLMGIAITRACG
jgi:hypothetical protein